MCCYYTNIVIFYYSVKGSRHVPFIAAIIVAGTWYAIPMGDTQSKSLIAVLT
jgi:hypothetical protein